MNYKLGFIVAGIVLAGCSLSTTGGDPSAVRIVRDNWGVPHIYADDVYGLYYGYGYAIGQDRLFQMEMARRSTQGTVAEVLGADYVDYDRSTRALFSAASIRAQLADIDPADRDVFEGYAAGLNAWIDQVRLRPSARMPKQFVDFGFEPSDWTAYDVAMIFVGTMNNRYGDFNTELENAAIYRSLAETHGEPEALALFDLLNPRFTDNAPTSIPRADWSRDAYDALADAAPRNLPAASAMRAAPASADRSSGFSNVFIIGRSKAGGANAILVNGPQFGWFNPAYVYSVGLHGAGIDVVGNSPFGYPMIMFGHNETIAWGSTWGASDIVDLYAERLNPDNPEEYFHDGAYREFEAREETIQVKGGPAERITLRRSVHGPVVDYAPERGVAYAKRRAWDGGELDTLLAWLRATWATDWDEWRAEAAKSAINVNMYFADVDGNIGYFHGGHFPLRVAGHDNRFPAPGDGSMEWQGRQPIDSANPHVLNPAGGFLANWNNKPGHGVMNPDFFFYSWSAADRVDHLNDALAARQRFTPDDAWALLDTSSYADLYVRYFLPAIAAAAERSQERALLDAYRSLAAWDGQSRDGDGDGRYDAPQTALFQAFVAALLERTLADDLGSAYAYFEATGYPTAAAPTGAGTNLPPAVKAIVEAIDGDTDYDPFNGEPPADVVADALRDALERASANAPNGLPVAARPFSSRNFLGIPQAAATEAMTAPIEQNRGTENNMIVMRPNAIVGWEVTPPGQSGFVDPDGNRSPHYDDQFDLYHQFGKKRTWFYDEDVEANKVSEIVLRYAR